VMSANPLTQTGGVYSYDFTTPSGQAYNDGQKEIAPGIWGMIAGDADASSSVNANDNSNVWQVQAGLQGYLSGDLNMDSEIDNVDKDDYLLRNMGQSCQTPD